MLINHSNHKSINWSEKQKKAALEYGQIIDKQFPIIQPEWNEEEVEQLAYNNAKEIIAMKPNAVMCQGEYLYTFMLVNYLKENGIIVLAACSKRITVETTDADNKTMRESQFEFVRFRRY